MKKTILLILLPLLIAVAGWIGYQKMTERQSGLPPLNTVVVDSGDVSQRIVAHGTLQPTQMITVGSQVSGIVDEIHVDFNAVVRRGQILARIDPSTFEAAVSSAQAELESTKAALTLAEVQYKRVLELQERQFVSQSDVDQAKATLSQATAQVQVRQHALERAQRELERCTIYSPTDGIVISRDVDVGQTVAASLSAPVLFELATNLDQMYIHANVSEADIGQIQEGQLVRFRVDAFRDRQFEGRVIQVRNAPLIMDNVVHYESIIAVDNAHRLLRPGMTAEVNIITAEQQNTLRIRNTALRARLPDAIMPQSPELQEPYNAIVFRRSNGIIEPVPIQTGLSDGVFTEVISGLSLSDTLAVGLTLRTDGGSSSRGGLFSGNQATF